MANIVIVGASTCGHTVASKIRELDKESRISLIGEENYPAYDRRRLIDFLAGTIREEELFLSGEDFYQRERIEFLKARKVSGINPQRKTVYFKEKGTLGYDFLVIASGRRVELPDIAGNRKEGVYALYCLDDFKKWQQYVVMSTVCIVGSTEAALNLGRLIISRNKVDVKIISNQEITVPIGFVMDDIEIIRSRPLEIIGEGKTDAVKLESGKVIGACAILFLDGLKANIDLVKNSGIDTQDERILVDNSMRTNVKDIFSCGAVAMRRDGYKTMDNWQDTIEGSILLADNLIKQAKGETCQTF